VNRSSGFVYLISVYGTTGSLKSLEDYTLYAIRNTKRIAGLRLPIAVGFGITKPSHARYMVKYTANEVIAGSAIIKKIKSNDNNNSNKTEMLERLHSYTHTSEKSM
jgi:tryptophan synthase alpha chain